MGTGLLEYWSPLPSACGHVRMCRLGTAQGSQLGEKVGAVFVEFICPEKAPLFSVHWELYSPAPSGPHPWLLQLRSLECLIRLPQGSLQHRYVLCLPLG